MISNKFDYPVKPFFTAGDIYILTKGDVSVSNMFKLVLSESKRFVSQYYLHLMLEVLKELSRQIKSTTILHLQRLISQIATVFKDSVTALKYISLVYQLATVS